MQLERFNDELETPQEALEYLTPIQFAAKTGDFGYIETQLDAKNVTERQRILEQKTTTGGFTALHYAAYYGQIGSVRVLLAFGASVHSVTQLQMNPIQLALIAHNSDKAKQFELFEHLNTDPIALTHPNKNGDTLAHLAAEFGASEILAIIVSQASRVLTTKNAQGLTPLLVGLLNNKTKEVMSLLLHDSVKQKDYKGRTALHYAVLYNPESCLAMLVPHFERDVRDQDGFSALDYAKQQNHQPKIDILTQAFPVFSLKLG